MKTIILTQSEIKTFVFLLDTRVHTHAGAMQFALIASKWLLRLLITVGTEW
jgi:hypothetical protein